MNARAFALLQWLDVDVEEPLAGQRAVAAGIQKAIFNVRRWRDCAARNTEMFGKAALRRLHTETGKPISRVDALQLEPRVEQRTLPVQHVQQAALGELILFQIIANDLFVGVHLTRQQARAQTTV